MDYQAALAYLDEHANLEKMLGGGRVDVPTLDRMARLVDAMGDPQQAYPVVHITGTNGKGSTAQIATRLLMAQGLRVGTCTSPHLERVNERIAIDGEPVDDETFAEEVAAVADLEIIAGVRPSYFEITTAAAYRAFADAAVDVAVVEVGLLGRWDATNVADATVAVVTNVGLDHTEYAGPTRVDIAREKAGIVKPGCTLVLGETDPELTPLFLDEKPGVVWSRELDFDAVENQLALGGRLLTLRTPLGLYPEVFLPLHGQHQGDNAAAALTAVESFFASPLDLSVVEEGFGAVTVPGRFEVLGHQPLVIVDGAHNPSGAEVCATVFEDDFAPPGRRIFVIGMLRGREPREMLDAFRVEDGDLVVCCTAPTPRALPAEDIARAARQLGIDDVLVERQVERACDMALQRATADDAVLISGSLYLVGAARPYLLRRLPG